MMQEKKKKNSIITEDDLKLAENNVQKLTDSKVEEIDKILESKEKRSNVYIMQFQNIIFIVFKKNNERG